MQKLRPYVSDNRHACRLCKRIERQQQKQQEDLLEAQKQQLEEQKEQYIEFMTKMRQRYLGPDPTCPGQTHTHCANGQPPLPFPGTDGDAHEYHQQLPEQLLQPLPEQVQQQTPQGRRAQLSRSQALCEELAPTVQTPGAFSHEAYNR